MKLKVKHIDMDTGEYTAVLHDDDCLELGVRENDRVKINGPIRSLIALVQTTDSVLDRGEVGILGKAFKFLGADIGEEVEVLYTHKPESVKYIKKKMGNEELTTEEINTLVKDITNRNLSPIELSAYITSLHINGMNLRETADLTKAMVRTGEIIDFDRSPVFDFHSVGGVPGNKITLLVVPIVAAAGLLIPKTSSRAISSAGGTADIVEVFCNVDLGPRRLKQVAEEIGGTLAWGGSMNLAPADDLIIKVEYPLGIDPHAQLLASVMSKKKAIGADFLVIDIPMGEGTKVPTMDEARSYARDFMDLGEKLGIKVECAVTYGDQPVGMAIGPALEALEAISILEGAQQPNSVIEKACEISGILLEMGGQPGGYEKAKEILLSGKAMAKFREIVAAQGGDPDIRSADIPIGAHREDILSTRSGYVNGVRNKDIVALARTAGAPKDKGAGVVIYKKRGNRVDVGDPLFTIYADNETKLRRAVASAKKLSPVIIEGMVLARIPSVTRF